MTAHGWSEIKAVLADVLEAEPATRPSVLDRLCGDDTGLRRAVESLLALETRAGSLLDSAALPGAVLRPAAEAPPDAIGPYRILREIGHGGMGVVYLGERADGQYRKQVAIKVITSGWRDRGLERRFERERQILAQLEHPGIARFLDGGATAEGRPYFVMEFIQGLPLLAWCESNHLTIAARLRLFLQVCDAVSYAHQRLVVHRDLKPGNILVTGDGTAKLLDFGLARVLAVGGEPGDDLTLTGVPLMTPAYASPEQVRGELYTVSGDVYSLGVIFYELLTATRPYQVSTTSYLEMARAICEQEPPPLSHAAADERLRRALRGDLEKIAAKTLAKDVPLRYASVDEFSSDIRRYLDGRPVLARPATFAYRVGKFLRRHRLAIGATTLAAVLILGFAAVALWQANRAQRRFQDVRGLAHSVIFELHDSIAKLPGSTAARELPVRRALEYLENLSREASHDPGLAREVALGYEKIGDVEGNLGDSNLGRVSAAVESYSKAEGILAGLVQASPGDPALRRDYLRVARELASLYGDLGKYDPGMRLVNQSIALAESAERANPSDMTALSDVAAGKAILASLLSNQHDYTGATKVREQVLEITRRTAAARPLDLESQANLALAYKHLAALYGVTGRLDDARRNYEQARTIDEVRTAAAPTDMKAKLDLSFDYSDLGWVAGRQRDFPRALESHRRALALRQEAAAADPQNFRAATTVASSVGRIAVVLGEMNDFSAAVPEAQRSIALYAALVARPGANWRTSIDLADAHNYLANIYATMAERKRVDRNERNRAWELAAAEFEKTRDILLALQVKRVLLPQESKRLDELAREIRRCRAASLPGYPK
jgi:non-specific serine/threonine protein kinase/serine/threonine-protein kinase